MKTRSSLPFLLTLILLAFFLSCNSASDTRPDGDEKTDPDGDKPDGERDDDRDTDDDNDEDATPDGDADGDPDPDGDPDGDTDENGDTDEDADEGFMPDGDFEDFLAPPTLPWQRLTRTPVNPFTPQPCPPDPHYPDNATREGALELFPGDCLSDMTLCPDNRTDWYVTDVTPGNTLVIWGIPGDSGLFEGETGFKDSSALGEWPFPKVFWDGVPESPYLFSTTTLPSSGVYILTYSFCINQGPVRTAWSGLPTPHRIQTDHFTFARSVPTDNDRRHVPSCLLREEPPPPFDDWTYFTAVIRLDYDVDAPAYYISLRSYLEVAVEFLDSCRPDARRLSCTDGSHLIEREEVPEEAGRPPCVLVGIGGHPELRNPGFVFVFERGEEDAK